MTLSPEHAGLLRASAISGEVVGARGYFTATSGAELGRIGFDTYQRIAPALVLPSWGVDGEIVNYQARPDRPRIDRERGREVKYETVAGSRARLDVPPACRPHLGSTRRPLWITEGIRKGDALASADLCAVALLGVDCISTGVIDDWDRIALDERRVYVVFDSDVMRKTSVHGALERLVALLTGKGAAVHPVYLPDDGGKIGADDYLAAGHTVDGLYAHAEDELRPLPVEGTPHAPAAWPAAALLDTVGKLLRRYVRFPGAHEAVALALYVLHTYAFDAAVSTPYLLIVSPEKRAGKTRTLETVELVVREPLRAGNITAAGVFQAIEAWTPTLLVDEVDAVFRVRSEQNETLRAVLNAGNRRGSYVVRGTQDGTPQKFSTWSAKVLAGINTGKLPDTIRDRSIVLNMERLAIGERVDDLFPAELDEVLGVLRGRLEAWAAENAGWLAAWRRSARVTGLDSRKQEAWDPLLAIADLAGPAWAESAAAAATQLERSAIDPSDAELGHLLLVTLRDVFDEKGTPLASATIGKALNALEELPFTGMHEGGGIKPRDLAKLLKPYGIKSKGVWIEDKTLRGYEREQFAGAWKRYAPDEEHARAEDPSGEAQGPQGPQDPSPDGKGDLADLADLADRNGPPAARVSPNGRAPIERREPTCANPAHRASDWALPGASMWVCGVCHPPTAAVAGRVVYRREVDHAA